MILVDAGPLFAQVDRRDRHHGACRRLLESERLLAVPVMVVAEAAYHIGKWVGAHAEIAFAADIASGRASVEEVAQTDWPRIVELAAQYRDLPLGIVDASVVACAERLGVTTIATTDRRDFSVVRPRHVEAFELVP